VKVYTIDDQQQRTTSFSGTFSMWNAHVDPHWLKVVPAQPFQPGKSYQVEGTKPDETAAFAPYTVDTKATATVALIDPKWDPNPCTHGLAHVSVNSKIALQADPLPHVQILAQDAHGSGSPAFALESVVLKIPDPSNIGSARACTSIPLEIRRTKHFTISSVKNIFGQALEAKGKYGETKAPSDQASSSFYAKFDGQAGEGQKPGYTVQGSLTPEITSVGAGFYLTPNADVDLGYGSLDTSKVSDMIKAGAGLTRYFSWTPGNGLKFEPSFQYETDRRGNHRNALFNGQAQLFLKQWHRSIADQTYLKYAKAIGTKDAYKSVDEVPTVAQGWQLDVFLGTEDGGAIGSNAVKSSDKSSSVVLPGYSIARILPRVSWTGEYKSASLNLDATARVLFPEENVTRERKIVNAKTSSGYSQQIYLIQTSGLRPTGKATFQYNLDPPGHFCLSISYQGGSTPPNFNHVSQVETGLVLKY